MAVPGVRAEVMEEHVSNITRIKYALFICIYCICIYYSIYIYIYIHTAFFVCVCLKLLSK